MHKECGRTVEDKIKGGCTVIYSSYMRPTKSVGPNTIGLPTLLSCIQYKQLQIVYNWCQQFLKWTNKSLLCTQYSLPKIHIKLPQTITSFSFYKPNWFLVWFHPGPAQLTYWPYITKHVPFLNCLQINLFKLQWIHQFLR